MYFIYWAETSFLTQWKILLIFLCIIGVRLNAVEFGACSWTAVGRTFCLAVCGSKCHCSAYSAVWSSRPQLQANDGASFVFLYMWTLSQLWPMRSLMTTTCCYWLRKRKSSHSKRCPRASLMRVFFSWKVTVVLLSSFRSKFGELVRFLRSRKTTAGCYFLQYYAPMADSLTLFSVCRSRLTISLLFLQMSHSSSTSSVLSSDSDTQTPFRSSDTCVIRVSLDTAEASSDTKTHVYKSIMVRFCVCACVFTCMCVGVKCGCHCIWMPICVCLT